MEKEITNPETTADMNAKTKKPNMLQKVGDKFLLYLAENPGSIIPFASILFGGLNLLINCRIKQNSNCWVKDIVTEEKFLAKHPLTNSEILELGERMSNGELKGEALSNMGLLKEEKRRK